VAGGIRRQPPGEGAFERARDRSTPGKRCCQSGAERRGAHLRRRPGDRHVDATLLDFRREESQLNHASFMILSCYIYDDGCVLPPSDRFECDDAKTKPANAVNIGYFACDPSIKL